MHKGKSQPFTIAQWELQSISANMFFYSPARSLDVANASMEWAQKSALVKLQPPIILLHTIAKIIPPWWGILHHTGANVVVIVYMEHLYNVGTTLWHMVRPSPTFLEIFLVFFLHTTWHKQVG